MSHFDPYFSSKLGKMYSFHTQPPTPFFFTPVAFRVDGRCWASLSETWPSWGWGWGVVGVGWVGTGPKMCEEYQHMDYK